MITFAITLGIAFIGGKIGLKLKIPAGAMIGALITVAAYNLITGEAYLPQSYKVITQISTGIFIGARIKKDDILGLREVIKPACLVVLCMAVMNFIMGYFLHKSSGMDIVTALFSTAPGGLMDMTLIAHELNADAAKVVVLQLVRLISVLAVIPVMLKALIKANGAVDGASKSIPSALGGSEESKNNFKNLGTTLIIGSTAGVIGSVSGVPAGALSFAMMGAAVFNIAYDRAFMPIKLRQMIQVLGGALIGSRVAIEDVLGMKDMLPAVAVIVIGFSIMNYLIGMFLYKVTNFNMATSLFSAAPGGVSDIAIIASEMGADAPKVAVIQLMRLVSVVGIYPILIQMISGYFI